VSPDGKRLFSAGSDQTIKVWDTHTGTELMSLQGHSDDVISLAVSADGKRLFSGSLDQTIILWDLELRREILTIRGHPSYVAALALVQDGKRLLSMSTRPMVWDLDSGREIATLRGHKGAVDSLALAPDGQRLISASSDRTVRISDLETGNEVFILGQSVRQDGGGAVPVGGSHLAISADGQSLYSARGKSIKIWDLAEGKELGSLSVETKLGLTCLALSPDGRRLYAGSAEGLTAWDTDSQKQVAAPPDTLKRISCVAVSPEGTLFAAGMATPSEKDASGRGPMSTIKAWDKSGKECLDLPSNADAGVQTCLAFSADGQRLFVGSGDLHTEATGEITDWDLKAGKQTHTLSGHRAPVRCLLNSADGRRLISGDSSGAIVIWNLETGKAIITLRGHLGAVLGLTMSADGKRLFSASADHTIRVWDVAGELSETSTGK
jgi:WD40 repeat protein